MSDFKYLEAVFTELMFADTDFERQKWGNLFRNVWEECLKEVTSVEKHQLPKFHECYINEREKSLYERGLADGSSEGGDDE